MTWLTGYVDGVYQQVTSTLTVTRTLSLPGADGVNHGLDYRRLVIGPRRPPPDGGRHHPHHRRPDRQPGTFSVQTIRGSNGASCSSTRAPSPRKPAPARPSSPFPSRTRAPSASTAGRCSIATPTASPTPQRPHRHGVPCPRTARTARQPAPTPGGRHPVRHRHREHRRRRVAGSGTVNANVASLATSSPAARVPAAPWSSTATTPDIHRGPRRRGRRCGARQSVRPAQHDGSVRPSGRPSGSPGQGFLPPSETFTVLDNTGSGAVAGTFAGPAEGATLALGLNLFGTG